MIIGSPRMNLLSCLWKQNIQIDANPCGIICLMPLTRSHFIYIEVINAYTGAAALRRIVWKTIKS